MMFGTWAAKVAYQKNTTDSFGSLEVKITTRTFSDDATENLDDAYKTM